MQITGKNLRLVHDALIDAIAEVHNRIATCPDVFYYADDIEECEQEKAAYESLLARVQQNLTRGA